MFRAAFRRLLAIDDPPERTALAFSIGVFIAFSPFLGLHTILATLIAFMFRFNKVAIYTGTFLNNPPLTLVPFAYHQGVTRLPSWCFALFYRLLDGRRSFGAVERLAQPLIQPGLRRADRRVQPPVIVRTRRRRRQSPALRTNGGLRPPRSAAPRCRRPPWY